MKVLKFYKLLLSEYRDAQRLASISLQMTRIMNCILDMDSKKGAEANKSTAILNELYAMMNILIYPQKIKVTAASNHQGGDSSQREQQERVRDYIQYLKTAKQVLASSNSSANSKDSTYETELFALSDVIDDQNVNCEALIRHMMSMYEGIVGTNAVGKLDNIAEIDVLSKLDISELQRDLVPLISIIKNEDPSSSEKK